MATSSDAKRPRPIRAEFDSTFDATDLEVEGNCFDAARVNYKGQKVLR